MKKYIGGDFDDSVSVSFETERGDYDTYFPEKLSGRGRSFYETATDSLAGIICEVYSDFQLPVCLWVPSHYCFETIYRLQNKLKMKVPFSFKSFNGAKELKKSDETSNIVLFNHFNMYDTSAVEIIKYYRENKWLVVEDFVHAPFDIIKTSAQYSFNSLRKVSDIEVSVCYSLIPKSEETEEPSFYYMIKKESASIKSAFLSGGDRMLEQQYLDLFKKAEASLSRPETVFAYKIEVNRLKKINWKSIIETRKNNYKVVSEKFGKIKQIEEVPGEYMYYIFKAPERNELRQFMFSNGVFPVIHWPDSENSVKNELLSFHIDQRYDEGDMERCGQLAEEFLVRSNSKESTR